MTMTASFKKSSSSRSAAECICDSIGKCQDSSKEKASLKSVDSSCSLLARDITGSSRDKSVRFSSVDVRDYTLCLGDNPSVTRGVPISLDWDYGKAHSYEIDAYERDRCDDRRDSDDLKLPSLQRVQMLKRLGYSRGEINERVKEVDVIKDNRFSTRRKAEREENRKKLVRRVVKRVGKILPSGPRKTEHWSFVAKTERCKSNSWVESDDDALTSSTSTRNSDAQVEEVS